MWSVDVGDDVYEDLRMKTVYPSTRDEDLSGGGGGGNDDDDVGGVGGIGGDMFDFTVVDSLTMMDDATTTVGFDRAWNAVISSCDEKEVDDTQVVDDDDTMFWHRR